MSDIPQTDHPDATLSLTRDEEIVLRVLYESARVRRTAAEEDPARGLESALLATYWGAIEKAVSFALAQATMIPTEEETPP